MSSKPKTEMISNVTETVSNIYSSMKNSTIGFSIIAFKGYITSNNVPDDKECKSLTAVEWKLPKKLHMKWKEQLNLLEI